MFGLLSESETDMTDEELIKGLVCIREVLKSLKDKYPMQTENQIEVINEVINRIDKGV